MKICQTLKGKLERSMVLPVGFIKLQLSNAYFEYFEKALINLVFAVLLFSGSYLTFLSSTPDVNVFPDCHVYIS